MFCIVVLEIFIQVLEIKKRRTTGKVVSFYGAPLELLYILYIITFPYSLNCIFSGVVFVFCLTKLAAHLYEPFQGTQIHFSTILSFLNYFFSLFTVKAVNN